MHAYLRSVGFSEYQKKKDIDKLMSELEKEFADGLVTYAGENGEIRGEIRAEVAANMGVCICGVVDDDGRFDREYYYPYLRSTDESTHVPVTIHRLVNAQMYSGLEDDSRLGITLIFRLDNAFEFMKQLERDGGGLTTGTYLAAFSSDGKILFPVSKTESQVLVRKENSRTRDILVEAAKAGDEKALEELTATDMNTFSTVAKRLQSEDIYSIVDTCFMPQGVECDIYQIVGDIIEVHATKNYMTKEELYDITLECNDMTFHVGINKKDLVGEPAEGRRFKGRIWMMGRVE